MECKFYLASYIFAILTINGKRFLWVTFQLSDICSRHSDYDIRVALQELPRGLVETYDRLLGRVLRDGNEELVQKIFRWVACARRPLSLEELQEAVAVEPHQEYSEPDRYINGITRIPLWCHGLASCDEEDGALQFAHSTIKDFLFHQYRDKSHSNFHINPTEADIQLGEACVTYLSFNDFKTQLIKGPTPQNPDRTGRIPEAAIRVAVGSKASLAISRLTRFGKRGHYKRAGSEVKFPWSADSENKFNNHPFLEYASANWLFHSKGFRKENVLLWEKWTALLLSETDLLEESIEGTQKLLHLTLDQQHHALLQWAADMKRQFTSSEIEALSERDLCVEPTTFMRTIMQAAGPTEHHALSAFRFEAKEDESKACRLEVELVDDKLIKVLLKSEFETYESALKSLLHQAADDGHIEAVKMLLDADSGMNSKEKVLQDVSRKGYTWVAESLAAKADANSPPCWDSSRTALQAAAESDHIEMLNRLIAAGADVNKPGKGVNGRTALQAAAESGHSETVNRLLLVGADVNAPAAPDHGRTALQAAAESGHIEILNRLLAAGADVNAPAAERGGRTALQAAAESGHSRIVDKLLIAGADVNASGAPRGGTTAFEAAVVQGHVDIVAKLRGAKVDLHARVTHGPFETVGQAARECGNPAIVEELDKYGPHSN